MLSNKKIICPKKLIEIANKKRPVSAAIVNAGKPLPMHATMEAVSKKLIIPIFIGNQKEINNSAKKLNWDISKYEIIVIDSYTNV
jgi:phosphotransacetylase